MIQLRKAVEDDCRDVYEWRNSQIARQFSNTEREIPYEEHLKWFNSSLRDQSRTIYIVLDEGEKIGQIRFDEESDDTARVSITVKPEECGKGYGAQIIRKGTREYFRINDAKKIIAEIKLRNIVSRRAFEKAGYKLVSESGEVLTYALEKMRVALVLAHELEKSRNGIFLDNQTRGRTDLGIRLLMEGEVDGLIMSGGHGDVGVKYGISLARAMKDYAIQHGVEEEQVIEEDLSLDTAGQLVFTRLGILEPRNWGEVVIVTNKWHHARTKAEADFILRGFKLDYRLVEGDSALIESLKKREEKSLESFWRTFNGVNPERGEEILRALLTKHPFYKCNIKESKRRLTDLISKQNE